MSINLRISEGEEEELSPPSTSSSPPHDLPESATSAQAESHAVISLDSSQPSISSPLDPIQAPEVNRAPPPYEQQESEPPAEPPTYVPGSRHEILLDEINHLDLEDNHDAISETLPSYTYADGQPNVVVERKQRLLTMVGFVLFTIILSFDSARYPPWFGIDANPSDSSSFFYFLTSMAFSPLLASMSDYFGRRWTLLISVFLYTIGFIVAAPQIQKWEMPLSIVSRIMCGIGGGGMWITIFTIISDIYPFDQRPRRMAIIWLVYGISSIVLPYITIALIDANFDPIHYPFHLIILIVPATSFMSGIPDLPQRRRSLPSSTITRRIIAMHSHLLLPMACLSIGIAAYFAPTNTVAIWICCTLAVVFLGLLCAWQYWLGPGAGGAFLPFYLVTRWRMLGIIITSALAGMGLFSGFKYMQRLYTISAVFMYDFGHSLGLQTYNDIIISFGCSLAAILVCVLAPKPCRPQGFILGGVVVLLGFVGIGSQLPVELFLADGSNVMLVFCFVGGLALGMVLMGSMIALQGSGEYDDIALLTTLPLITIPSLGGAFSRAILEPAYDSIADSLQTSFTPELNRTLQDFFAAYPNTTAVPSDFIYAQLGACHRLLRISIAFPAIAALVAGVVCIGKERRKVRVVVTDERMRDIEMVTRASGTMTGMEDAVNGMEGIELDEEREEQEGMQSHLNVDTGSGNGESDVTVVQRDSDDGISDDPLIRRRRNVPRLEEQNEEIVPTSSIESEIDVTEAV